jgi:hypothetical protein
MAGERRLFRALGGVDKGSAVPPGEVAEALRAEFERVFALKGSLRDEAEAPVSPTGRRTTADAEAKLRTLVASVEGGKPLRHPAGSAGSWAGACPLVEAIGRGLHDGLGGRAVGLRRRAWRCGGGIAPSPVPSPGAAVGQRPQAAADRGWPGRGRVVPLPKPGLVSPKAHQRQHSPDVVALARLRSLFPVLVEVPRLRSAAWGVSRRAPAPRWPLSPAVHLPTLA